MDGAPAGSFGMDGAFAHRRRESSAAPNECTGVGRIVHEHGGSPLVIIEVVDVDGVAVLETKDDAPIRAHRHRPESRKVSLERVKPEAGDVQ